MVCLPAPSSPRLEIQIADFGLHPACCRSNSPTAPVQVPSELLLPAHDSRSFPSCPAPHKPVVESSHSNTDFLSQPAFTSLSLSLVSRHPHTTRAKEVNSSHLISTHEPLSLRDSGLGSSAQPALPSPHPGCCPYNNIFFSFLSEHPPSADHQLPNLGQINPIQSPHLYNQLQLGSRRAPLAKTSTPGFPLAGQQRTPRTNQRHRRSTSPHPCASPRGLGLILPFPRPR